MKRNPKEIACALAALALLSGAAGCSFSSDVAEGIGPYGELSSEGGASSEGEPSSSSEEALSSSGAPAAVAVTIDCGANGTCDPDGVRNLVEGDSLRVLAKAGERRFVETVEIDGDTVYSSVPGERSASYWIDLKDLRKDAAVRVAFGREGIWMDCSAGGPCIPGDTTPAIGSSVALKFQADSGYKIQTVVFGGDTIFSGDTTASVYGQYNFALGNYQPSSTFDFVADFVAY
ncbi:MAG: hypothetical protein J6V65_01150 [Fibrobacterales bacterium]|nr:hypothetical protein [Fibrobacterales bacterium]